MGKSNRQSQFAPQDADEPASKSKDGIYKQDAFHFVTYVLNFEKTMIIYLIGQKKMKRLCVRAPEYLGCYTLPYEAEFGKQEVRLEGGLLKVSVPVSTGLKQKHIYRPLA